MKKLLFLLCISINTFGQINLGVGESKTLEGGEYSVQMNEGAILYLKGYVTITSLSKYKDATINIDKDAVVNVESSVNINGGSNLFVFGKLTAANIEVHGGMNAISVQGKLQSNSNFILNDGSSEVSVCGEVEVSGVTNWNPQSREKAIVLCNCGVWKTWRLNSHRENVVTGEGSVYYTDGNIKGNLSSVNTVYINRGCSPLPVEIVSFDIRYNEIGEKQYNLKLSEDSTPRTFVIFESLDGKNWKEVVRREVFLEQGKSVGNNFSGIIK